MSRQETRGLVKAFSLISQLGLTVSIAILIGAALGRFLQIKLGLGAIGFLFGLFSGLGGAFLGAKSMLEEILRIPFEPGKKIDLSEDSKRELSPVKSLEKNPEE